ncbi:MAG: radical SAM protein [Armatimonadia bacterium]
MARVLFIHCRKETPENPVPHLGLASLCSPLRQAGHEVLVLDEAILPREAMPPLGEVIAGFGPDVIGFSVYTATLTSTLEYIRQAREASHAAVLAGGPHATLFPETLAQTQLVDCVVQGEAENVIVELVETVKRGDPCRIVRAPEVDVQSLLWPDYTGFVDWEKITFYPVNTSRGCPFCCSFCAVEQITSRRWRPRDPADCAAEVAAARRQFANLCGLKVTDDCPTCRADHFKAFLRLLGAQEQPPLPLVVDNVRADRVDAEFLELVKAAGATEICLGVESGDPDVFALVDKKESLEEVARAAQLIRQHGLTLGLCFIIGLPGDTFARTRGSVRLARRLKADKIFWNMMHPFPGTPAYEWFEQHGASVDPPRTYTSYDTHQLQVAEPAVETSDFTKADRRRAYFLAAVATDQFTWDREAFGHLLRGAVKYRLPGPVFMAMLRHVKQRGLHTALRIAHRVRRLL